MTTLAIRSTHARAVFATLALAAAAGCSTSNSTPTASRYAPSAVGGERGGGNTVNVSDEQTQPAMGTDGPAYEAYEQPMRVGAGAAFGANQPAFVAGPGMDEPEPAGYGQIPSENNTLPGIDALKNLSQLTFAQEGADFDPKLSRDGQWLVFASTQHRPTADIYIKAVGGRTVTQLTSDPASDVMPTLSPDGARIAFASNRTGFWNLYVMSAKGGQAVQLSASNAHELHPSWSPDGKRLAFCRLGQVSGRWELWVMEVARPQTAEFIGYGMFPEWCPVAQTGSNETDKILFQRGRERGDRAFSLWTVDFTPGMAEGYTEVASHKGLAATNASWSPDGKWIVYSTNKPGLTPIGGKSGPSDLWVASVDGNSRAALTGGRFGNALPTWGPNNRIYFVSNRGGVENVWSIGAEKALAAAGVLTEQPVANAPADENQ